MKKLLGIALSLALAFPLVAHAAEMNGTVKTIDRANQAFTLEDGTQLTLSEGALAELAPGEKVRAAYEVKNGRNVVIELSRVTNGPDGQLTTNFAGPLHDRANDIEGD